MNTATIILSRARADILMERGLTLHWMQHLGAHTFLLVHFNEIGVYTPVAEKYRIPVLVHAVENKVSEVRDHAIAFAMGQGYERLWLLDDDLLFSYRDWSSNRLPRLEPERIVEVRDHLETLCTDSYPMAGLRHRMFAHSCKSPLEYNKRILWTPMLHLPTFQANNWQYKWEGDFMEDFRLQCNIVKDGYCTVTTNSYVADDALGAWRSGGCNEYRNNAGRNKAATLLQQQYPNYITLVQKQDPSGEDYLDVRMKLSRT